MFWVKRSPDCGARRSYCFGCIRTHSWGISFLCGKLYVRVLMMRFRDYCWDRLAFISVTLGAVECTLFVIFQWDTYLRRALPKKRICSGPSWICQKSTIGSQEKRRDDSCESGNDARLRYCLPACSISTWMEWLEGGEHEYNLHRLRVVGSK